MMHVYQLLIHIWYLVKKSVLLPGVTGYCGEEILLNNLLIEVILVY